MRCKMVAKSKKVITLNKSQVSPWAGGRGDWAWEGHGQGAGGYEGIHLVITCEYRYVSCIPLYLDPVSQI